MTAPPTLAALALSLILALTSGTMAVARGQAMADGQIVICAGQVAVTISVDAQGNPTGPAHICPDCALSLLGAHALPPVTVAAGSDWRIEPFRAAGAALPASPPQFRAQARGPPAPI